MGTRILVTGSRTWTDNAAIRRALQAWRGADAVLVHGGAAGADRIAAAIWRRWGLPTEEHPADWVTHGRAAGMRRNAHMISLGADVCLAFIHNHSRGATHCATIAERAGIPTHRRTAGGPMSSDLFGHQIPNARTTDPPDVPDRVTNNIDEIVTVLRIASTDGYAVVGARQQLWRLVTQDGIEPVPRHEADTVRQLLDVGWLTLGGTHGYDHQGTEVAGRSLLVPKRSRQWLTRWDSRKHLGQPARGHRQ